MSMSRTAIAKWQEQIREGGQESLARGDNAQTFATRHETELAEQVEDMTSTLGEGYVEFRPCQRGSGPALHCPAGQPSLDLVPLASCPRARADGPSLAGPGRRPRLRDEQAAADQAHRSSASGHRTDVGHAVRG